MTQSAVKQHLFSNSIDRDMIAVRISDPIRRVVVAAPSYLAQHAAPQTPHDLARYSAIRFRLPGGGFIPWRFQEMAKASRQRRRAR